MQLIACSPERPPKTTATRGLRAFWSVTGVTIPAGRRPLGRSAVPTSLRRWTHANPPPPPSPSPPAGRRPSRTPRWPSPSCTPRRSSRRPGRPGRATSATAAGPTPPGRRSSPRSGRLEGGRARLFASGMAAVAAVLDQVPDGGRVVAPAAAYNGTLTLLGALADRGPGARRLGRDRRHGRRPRRAGRRGRPAVGRDAYEPPARGGGPARARRGGPRGRGPGGGRQHVLHAPWCSGPSTTAPTSSCTR